MLCRLTRCIAMSIQPQQCPRSPAFMMRRDQNINHNRTSFSETIQYKMRDGIPLHGDIIRDNLFYFNKHSDRSWVLKQNVYALYLLSCQYSNPRRALMPLSYGCFMSRISVTRSARSMSSCGALRPVKIICSSLSFTLSANSKTSSFPIKPR